MSIAPPKNPKIDKKNLVVSDHRSIEFFFDRYLEEDEKGIYEEKSLECWVKFNGVKFGASSIMILMEEGMESPMVVLNWKRKK